MGKIIIGPIHNSIVNPIAQQSYYAQVALIMNFHKQKKEKEPDNIDNPKDYSIKLMKLMNGI